MGYTSRRFVKSKKIVMFSENLKRDNRVQTTHIHMATKKLPSHYWASKISTKFFFKKCVFLKGLENLSSIFWKRNRPLLNKISCITLQNCAMFSSAHFSWNGLQKKKKKKESYLPAGPKNYNFLIQCLNKNWSFGRWTWWNTTGETAGLIGPEWEELHQLTADGKAWMARCAEMKGMT